MARNSDSCAFGRTTSQAALIKSSTLEAEGERDNEELGGRDQSLGNKWPQSAPEWETASQGV